jgi:hypothetical protein
MFVVTIEYADGQETKFTVPTWEDVKNWLNPRLDNAYSARQVKRVAICPRF